MCGAQPTAGTRPCRSTCRPGEPCHAIGPRDNGERRYAGWTPEEIRRQAARIGPNTANLVDVILRERTHPEQGFRSCLGIVRLAKPHGRDALEAACLRALEIHGWSYKSVNSILKNNLHRRRPEKAADGPAISHPNIRGASYYH